MSLPTYTSTLPSLTPAELRQFSEMFRLVDRDGNGAITKTEFTTLLSTLGFRLSSGEIDALMLEIDKNDDGAIDFNEFCAIMTRRVAAKYTVEQVRHAFQSLAAPTDRHHGVIDLAVIERALSSPAFTGSMEPSEANEKRRMAMELLDQLRVDYQGKFHYDQYINTVMQDK